MEIFGHDAFGPKNKYIFNNSLISYHNESEVICGRDATTAYVEQLVDQYLSGDKSIPLFGNMKDKGETMKEVNLRPFLIDMVSNSLGFEYGEIVHIIPIFGGDNETPETKAQTFIDYMEYGEWTYDGEYPDSIKVICPANLTPEQLGKKRFDGISNLVWPTSTQLKWSDIYRTGPDYSQVCFIVLVNDRNTPLCDYCRENYTLVETSNGKECKCESPYVINDLGKCALSQDSEEDCEWYEYIFGCGWYPTLWDTIRKMFK